MADVTTQAPTPLSPLAMQDVLAALSVSAIPDAHWVHDDGLCDCTFQRICFWTNPYIARTLKVRVCCIWAELYRQFPQFVQDIDAYYDGNRHRWVAEAAPWDSEEMPMPVSLWHRQIASRTGLSLAEVREEYAGREYERPQPVEPGTYPKDEPTEAELHAALEAQLRAATWILPDERLA